MSSARSQRRGGERVGPPLNRLVARRHDLEAAQRMLTQSRLITFTGPGGVGKTRLALEVAHRVVGKFPDGAWLVRLTDLSVGAGANDVEAAIVSALGISDQSATRPRDKLLSFLPERRVLLVLDNCEHVIDAVRLTVPVLLRAAPNLRIITTSREHLGVVGEVLRPVLPLSVPEPGTPADQLVADGSVSLLIERTAAVDPDFDVTGVNADAVIELCRLLEGSPLAIELAAAKLRSLTVEQVVERFRKRLTSLTASDVNAVSRHRSLRAMVEWSYDLCHGNAQVLWRRLAVFPATFDLELTEQICAFGELRAEDVFDAIDRLVAQSIVLTDRGAGTMRYHLPAAVREVAAELADQAGETEQLHRRHRDVMLRRAAEMLTQWCGPNQDNLIRQLSLDHPSYVAALHWSATTPSEGQAALELLGRLRYHWLTNGRLAEGRMRIESMLEAETSPSAARAHCLWVVTWIALLQGDQESAVPWLNELKLYAVESGDEVFAAHVRQWTALRALFTGDTTAAVRGFGQAVQDHAARGDREMELTARYMLASALVTDGATDRALAEARDAATLCEQYGERSAHAYAEWAAALAHWSLGHHDEAERSARRVLELRRTFGDGIAVALATDLLGWIANDRSQFGRSRVLLRTAKELWQAMGTSIDAFGPQLSGFAAAHTPTPTEPAPADMSRSARPMEVDEAIDFVLGVLDGVHRSARLPSEPLTKREFEVAALVEVGLSNREIAERLVISKRTADGHVERILAKLGFASRAQVAAWMARHPSPR
ncbi:LuxR C-terminal-related transcriptional regulator [Mycobacterium sp. 852013-50091_SCH5140682]|uniref:ATP-binding protein n=1 Tax=Mycobacterium sp. 852013-50091_SCH5140682 TaxID=1834109 RepID=UPI001E41AE4E|nr:LuxR C-terminal-related transcriptional regulator [Mycobacterium sp. 852013-50091_SCH5140682]